MAIQPNKNLKALQKGRRGARARYEELDDNCRLFLNEWANMYAADKSAAISFMVAMNQERQRRDTHTIQA